MKTYVSVIQWGTYLCLEWETKSYDKVYNTSDIYVRVYVTNNSVAGAGGGNASTSLTAGEFDLTMDVPGIEFSQNSDAKLDESNRECTILEQTFTIQHDSDGKKTVRICATLKDIKVSRAEVESDNIEETYICQYLNLVDIPQASEFKNIGRDVIVNGVNSLNVEIAPLDETCRHDLIISFGEDSETILNVKDKVSYIIPIKWLENIPNSNSGKGLIDLKTYDIHGNKIGSVKTYWNAIVPEDAIPAFDNLSIEQIIQSFGLAFGWVQSASKAKLEIVNARSEWGADIASYCISGCGYKGSSAILETGTINYSGLRTFSAYIIDSRGKQSEVKTVSINVVEYKPPRFLNVLSQRSEKDGTVKNEGSYLKSTVSFEIDSFDGLNSSTQSIYFKKSTETEYQKLSTSFLNGISNISNQLFNMKQSYNIQYRIVDKFGVSVYDDILSISQITMEFLKGGKGISFGKAAEIENAIDCGYKLYAREGIMPVSISMSGNSTAEIPVNLLNYSLFAIKIKDVLYPVLCFRILSGNGAYGSTSIPETGLKASQYGIHTVSVQLNLTSDGFTGTYWDASMQILSSSLISGGNGLAIDLTNENIEYAYALM